MAEDVRRLSDELARDPGSRVFVPLGAATRKQGQLDLARSAVDQGDLQRAFDEWDMVLRLVPNQHGALRGMGFVCFQQGRLPEAERYLGAAVGAGDTDEGVALALANVRAARQPAAAPAAAPPVVDARREVRLPPGTTHDPRFLFADVLTD